MRVPLLLDIADQSLVVEQWKFSLTDHYIIYNSLQVFGICCFLYSLGLLCFQKCESAFSKLYLRLTTSYIEEERFFCKDSAYIEIYFTYFQVCLKLQFHLKTNRIDISFANFIVNANSINLYLS